MLLDIKILEDGMSETINERINSLYKEVRSSESSIAKVNEEGAEILRTIEEIDMKENEKKVLKEKIKKIVEENNKKS